MPDQHLITGDNRNTQLTFELIDNRCRPQCRAGNKQRVRIRVRDLQRAIPVYIEGPRNLLCEATYVLVNEPPAGAAAAGANGGANGGAGGAGGAEAAPEIHAIDKSTLASARAAVAARTAELLQIPSAP